MRIPYSAVQHVLQLNEVVTQATVAPDTSTQDAGANSVIMDYVSTTVRFLPTSEAVVHSSQTVKVELSILS